MNMASPRVLTRPVFPVLRSTWVCRACLGRQKLAQRSSQAADLLHTAGRTIPAQLQRRNFHADAPKRREQHASQRQAMPLGDFYTDLLSTPIPESSHASSHASLPTFVQSGDETKEERARKLFGNIRGSGYERQVSDTPDATWRTINGVPIPPRPAEPENCCMSGCVHCVWDDYRDDVEQWALRLGEAQKKSPHRATDDGKIEMSRPEVSQASGSMDDDGGGSEALWTSPSAGGAEEDLFGGIPVGIREFMATEKRIRDRKKQRKAAHTAYSDD